MVLAGRQTINRFDEVIRLRRIHRQKGADGFKDSTIRLRDAANTVNDGFLSEVVVLIPENAAAGKANGKQVAARAPLVVIVS